MTPMLKAYKRRCEHPLSAGLCQVGRKQFVQDSSSWPRFEPNYPRPSERHDNPSFPERFDYTPNQASSMCPGQANCKYQKLNYYLLLFSLAPRTLVPCNQVLSLRLEGVGALGGKPHWPLLSLSLSSLSSSNNLSQFYRAIFKWLHASWAFGSNKVSLWNSRSWPVPRSCTYLFTHRDIHTETVIGEFFGHNNRLRS